MGTAHIIGTVTDAQTGKAVPGVNVAATSSAMPLIEGAATDEEGRYQITVSWPSSYSVIFFYGDIRVTTLAIVTSGSDTTVDVRMKAGLTTNLRSGVPYAGDGADMLHWLER